ncbi:MAG: hypothetical protein ACC657_03465 [Thiohalomonadales bacterium]
MTASNLYKIILITLSISLLSAFDFGSVSKSIDKTVKDVAPSDCSKSKNKSNCEKGEAISTAGKVVAIGIAAKLIYDMAVSFTSTSTKSEDAVVSAYRKKYGKLPKTPKVTVYNSSLKPGDIVSVGKKVRVVSNIEVVRSEKSPDMVVEEKFSIYDSEDNSKVMKSLVKPVKSKKSGGYKNEFVFTLPQGMPQGIYPIKSVAIVNGKEIKPAKNNMQLVLYFISPDKYQVVALNN